MVVYTYLDRLFPTGTPKIIRKLAKAIVIINGCIFDSVIMLLVLPMTVFVLGNPLPSCVTDYWHEMNQVMKPLHPNERFPVPARWAFQIMMALGGITSPVFGLLLRLFDRDGRPDSVSSEQNSLPAMHFQPSSHEDQHTDAPKGKRHKKPIVSERYLYINGIDTDYGLAMHNAECISAMVDRRVDVIYNPTHGTVVDLVECVWGRNLSLLTDVVTQAQKALKRCLNDPLVSKVCLVAHSQGTIIAFDAIARLIEENTMGVGNAVCNLGKLEVYTFGAAAKYTPIGSKEAGIFFEHHLNIFDPVACLGALWMPYGWHGVRYRYWATGHLMNACHLVHGVHPSSRFYSLCRADLGGKPPTKTNPVEWQTLIALAVVAGVSTVSVLVVSLFLLWAYIPAGLAVMLLVAVDFRSNWAMVEHQ